MTILSSPRFLRTVLWADAASAAGCGVLQARRRRAAGTAARTAGQLAAGQRPGLAALRRRGALAGPPRPALRAPACRPWRWPMPPGSPAAWRCCSPAAPAPCWDSCTCWCRRSRSPCWPSCSGSASAAPRRRAGPERGRGLSLLVCWPAAFRREKSHDPRFQFQSRSRHAARAGAAPGRRRDAGLARLRHVGDGDEPSRQGVHLHPRPGRGHAARADGHPGQLQGAVHAGRGDRRERHRADEPDRPHRQGRLRGHRRLVEEVAEGSAELRQGEPGGVG